MDNITEMFSVFGINTPSRMEQLISWNWFQSLLARQIIVSMHWSVNTMALWNNHLIVDTSSSNHIMMRWCWDIWRKKNWRKNGISVYALNSCIPIRLFAIHFPSVIYESLSKWTNGFSNLTILFCSWEIVFKSHPGSVLHAIYIQFELMVE